VRFIAARIPATVTAHLRAMAARLFQLEHDPEK